MRKILAVLTALACLAITGCTANKNDAVLGAYTEDKPAVPEKLKRGENGVPMLTVYDIRTENLENMDIETYVCGVVAGEMKNDWPEEALRAQAILARTYVLKFVQDKSSKYGSADISTDISEAQAYNAEAVNDNVKKAVESTRGEVMSVNGQYPYAWFHAHAGGVTELPTVALAYSGEDPAYLSVTNSPDSDDAPDYVKEWHAEFTLQQVQKACADAGVETGPVKSIAVASRGESGRAKTLLVNGIEVSAAEFRIQIGAEKLKSTLIHEIELDDGMVEFEGSGFGHGVGMSQWGAYAMAEEGKTAEDIVRHYFQGVDIVKLWE